MDGYIARSEVYITPKDASRLLGLGIYPTLQLCWTGELDSRFEGETRLISTRSVAAYAARESA